MDPVRIFGRILYILMGFNKILYNMKRFMSLLVSGSNGGLSYCNLIENDSLKLKLSIHGVNEINYCISLDEI